MLQARIYTICIYIYTHTHMHMYVVALIGIVIRCFNVELDCIIEEITKPTLTTRTIFTAAISTHYTNTITSCIV